jgi:hypothetical protein
MVVDEWVLIRRPPNKRSQATAGADVRGKRTAASARRA